ncbi:MAG: class I SAM-dependent methyltransferase [Candidatus Binataceae bacterium]
MVESRTHPPIDYGDLAPAYDASRRAERAIVEPLIAGLRSIGAAKVLEIGAGTGNYTREMSARGFAVVALDRTAEMANRGRAKCQANWLIADALALPFKASVIDAAAAVNVIHHLTDVPRALAEIRRVVRRGCVLQAVVRENLATLWYRHYFPAIDQVLLPLHLPLGALLAALLRAGFASVRSSPIFYSGCGDRTFESARTRPSLIFDEAFRAATSGFQRLAKLAVDCGIDELRRDLDSGRFARIAARCEIGHREAGDCVIITAAVRSTGR